MQEGTKGDVRDRWGPISLQGGGLNEERESAVTSKKVAIRNSRRKPESEDTCL